MLLLYDQFAKVTLSIRFIFWLSFITFSILVN